LNNPGSVVDPSGLNPPFFPPGFPTFSPPRITFPTKPPILNPPSGFRPGPISQRPIFRPVKVPRPPFRFRLPRIPIRPVLTPVLIVTLICIPSRIGGGPGVDTAPRIPKGTGNRDKLQKKCVDDFQQCENDCSNHGIDLWAFLEALGLTEQQVSKAYSEWFGCCDDYCKDANVLCHNYANQGFPPTFELEYSCDEKDFLAPFRPRFGS
jgi:hypothetical protein